MSTEKLNRRDAISAVGAGLAYGALGAASAIGADHESSVVKRHLYVTNDATRAVDVFDVNDEHALVRSFPMGGGKVGGISADAATNRIFITQQDENTVKAYGMLSGT